MGKCKINMARIEYRQKRHLCLKKMCASLFKKASELKTLCRADVAVVVLPSDDKPCVFDSPTSAGNVIRRYLTKIGESPPAADERRTSDSAFSSKSVLQLEDENSYVISEEKKTQLGEIEERVNIEAMEDLDELDAMDDLDELEELQERVNERREVLLAQAKQQPDQVNNTYCGQDMLGPVYDTRFVPLMEGYDAGNVFCDVYDPTQAMSAVSESSVSFTSDFVDSSFFDGIPDFFP